VCPADGTYGGDGELRRRAVLQARHDPVAPAQLREMVEDPVAVRASPSRVTGVSTPMAGIRSLTGTERARVRGDAGVPLVRTAEVGVVAGAVAEDRPVA
jgi:hypothetical protein